MHLLATAREQLCAIWHTTIAEELLIDFSLCRKHNRESQVFYIRHEKKAIATTTAYLMDPISGFDAILQLLPKPYKDNESDWCLKCIDEKQTSLNNRRVEIWDTLAQWLGLKEQVRGSYISCTSFGFRLTSPGYGKSFSIIISSITPTERAFFG
jgi:hypothetical protein